MSDVIEKRRFKRFEYREEVLVFPVHPTSAGSFFEVDLTSFSVHSLDISEGGIRLEWRDDLNPDLLLKLRLRLPQDLTVEIYGKVAWSEGGKAGIRFMVPDETLRHGVRSLSKKAS